MIHTASPYILLTLYRSPRNAVVKQIMEKYATSMKIIITVEDGLGVLFRAIHCDIGGIQSATTKEQFHAAGKILLQREARPTEATDTTSPWQYSYALLLLSAYSGDDSAALEETIQALETKHGIQTRWDVHEECFKHAALAALPRHLSAAHDDTVEGECEYRIIIAAKRKHSGMKWDGEAWCR